MKPSLFYDGTCPLCSKEISLLKRLSKNKLNFIDIHKTNESKEPSLGLASSQTSSSQLPSKDALLKRLHLLKSDGKWLIGLDANVYAWSFTPYGIFFKALRIWPLSKLADSIYTRWADKRFKKRYECGNCKI